jgi:TPR repeat protein
MKFELNFLSLYLIYFLFSLINCSDAETDSIFTLKDPSVEFTNDNHTDFVFDCEEGEIQPCYDKSINIISSFKFFDPKHIETMSDVDARDYYTSYNNILSEYWYYAGQLEYWGLIKRKPNLAEGLGKFIVASYFGSPKAMYKLYLLIETDILSLIYDSKDFDNVKEKSVSGKYLKHILNSTNTNFSANFQFSDDYEKNSIALQFLYSSALYKYQPAMSALAYKFYKGYGVSRSCDAALKYYKETSQENIRYITDRHKPNYYEKINLASYEYIGHKFSNEIMDIDDIIDYFKVEAQNGQINYIQQLGQRYLYGQGIQQDFDQAFYYFDMGARLNDSSCIYYLGEMYLNGWGVEKNYSEAFRLFSQAMTYNNHKAWNSLGYMYYHGLGVEKNVKRAYDYFKISFSKGEESDAYYNMITLLAEGNDKVEVDFPNAYKYANFIAAKGHTFGTYFFGNKKYT